MTVYYVFRLLPQSSGFVILCHCREPFGQICPQMRAGCTVLFPYLFQNKLKRCQWQTRPGNSRMTFAVLLDHQQSPMLQSINILCSILMSYQELSFVFYFLISSCQLMLLYLWQQLLCQWMFMACSKCRRTVYKSHCPILNTQRRQYNPFLQFAYYILVGLTWRCAMKNTDMLFQCFLLFSRLFSFSWVCMCECFYLETIKCELSCFFGVPVCYCSETGLQNLVHIKAFITAARIPKCIFWSALWRIANNKPVQFCWRKKRLNGFFQIT